MPKPQYSQKFRDEWLMDPLFRDWLHKVESTVGVVGKCKYCGHTVRNHRGDLKNHENSATHQKNTNKLATALSCDTKLENSAVNSAQQSVAIMPAATTATGEDENDASDKMWNALKRYIIRERQRKKEEYEAEVEEERLRKEQEARERQDVMTLEETKEQIEQLEQKLKQLEKEKQQLFMQLKKVLNEDDVRKRHQKETTEMQMPKMPMGNIQMPMFSMASSGGQGELPPAQGRPPPLTSHILNKQPQQRGPTQAGVKRQRSPSPSYQMYAHRMHQPPMKHQPVYSDHKLEDGRMGRQMSRAVLWNKPSQYSGCGSTQSPAYYAMPSSGVMSVVERVPPLLYAAHAHTPHTPHTPHHNLLYAPAPQPQLYLDMLGRDQHQDQKKDQPQVLIGLSEAHHPAVSSGSVYAQPARLMPQHNMQQPKPGSITQGYPVQQSNPNVQNPNIYPTRHRY